MRRTTVGTAVMVTGGCLAMLFAVATAPAGSGVAGVARQAGAELRLMLLLGAVPLEHELSLVSEALGPDGQGG